MRSILPLALAFLLTAAPRAQAAGQPLSYGGRLTDGSGKPVAGPVKLELQFFRQAKGGEPVLDAPLTYSRVALADGVFQLTLGLQAAALQAVFPDVATPVFVEVTDVTHNVTYPRQQFTMVPFAVRALDVGPATAPGPNQFLTKDGSGNLVWATPSTAASSLAGAAVGGTSPSGGQVLKYTGSQWLPSTDTSQTTQGVLTMAGQPAAPVQGQLWFDSSTGHLKFYDGSAAQTLGTSGSGLQSLNGLTPNDQFLGTPAIGGTSAFWSSAGATHTLTLPVASSSAAAGLLSQTDYASFQSRVSKAGDTMTGSLGIGTTSAATALDVVGALTVRGAAAPAVSSAGQGRLYFDTAQQQLLVSANGGAYAPLVLGSVGTPGAYAKVVTDAAGRVTAGTSLSAADLPAIPVGQLTGTLAAAQIAPLPVSQLSGTLTSGQLPAIPVGQLTGTLTAAQLPGLGAAQITSGTLAVTLGGTGSTNGSITGTGSLTFAAGGANQNVVLTPSGTGATLLNGNVGIGTTTPAFGLDVEKGVGNTYAQFGNLLPVYMIAHDPLVGFNTYFNSGWKFGAGSSGNYGGMLGFDASTGNFSIATSDAGNAGAAATLSSRLTILQSGKVGIGSTSPTATLDVAGDVKLSGDLLQTVPMISTSSTTTTVSWSSTTFADVTTALTFADRFSSGITRSGSVFTFAKGGTYMIEFNANGYGTNVYLSFRLRRTNGTPATLLQRTTYSGAASTADQFPGGLTGLFQVTAGDTVDLQYAVKSGTPSSWNASNPIDTEAEMVTAQLDMWRVQ